MLLAVINDSPEQLELWILTSAPSRHSEASQMSFCDRVIPHSLSLPTVGLRTQQDYVEGLIKSLRMIHREGLLSLNFTGDAER